MNSRLQRNMSFVFIDGVRQHTRISSTLHEPKIADHRGHLSPRTWPSKPSSLASGLKEIISTSKSQRRTSSLLISANYRGSSPRPMSNYRGTIRSWHGQTPPWRGPGRGLGEAHMHLTIDTYIRLSPGISAFHDGGHLRPERGGRSI
ncbi:hypothetical protein CDL15_Pgr015085 [Punica granatum]|uniref:Uncharacterized protein n=1 Tax=Punica granatum TaxID=22663 RepID=A0A218X0G1_PUNGR|nr:hypothetical protein CDL15_Pgr015085 [Punica granatum]